MRPFGGTFGVGGLVQLGTNLNQTPVFSSAATASFAENATGTVFTAIASPVDSYSIKSGGDGNSFNINSSTGAVTLKNPPDYETKNSYSLTVIATKGSRTTEQNITITITNVNETPTDIALSANTMAENTAANTTIGVLTTTDPDSGNTFTYTLVSGTGSTDNASFNISGANLRNTNVFDYETKSSYSVRIRSTDQGGLYFEKVFTITVTDVTTEFGITVDTTKAGSATNTFVLPTTGSGYNANINWGDGSAIENISGTPGNVTHVYPTTGTYKIGITGTFPRIYFNNGGDNAKLVSWDTLGSVGFGTNQTGAFCGCGLTQLPSDSVSFFNTLITGREMFRMNAITSIPAGITLASLTDGYAMFYDCSLTSLPSGCTLSSLVTADYMFYSNSITAIPSGTTFAGVTTAREMFRENSLSAIPSGVTLASLTDGYAMFLGNAITSVSSSLTFNQLTTANFIFLYNTINTTDYSNLLIAINANNTKKSVNFNGGSSKYNTSGQTARNALLARSPAWTITDGGLE